MLDVIGKQIKDTCKKQGVPDISVQKTDPLVLLKEMQNRLFAVIEDIKAYAKDDDAKQKLIEKASKEQRRYYKLKMQELKAKDKKEEDEKKRDIMMIKRMQQFVREGRV